MCTAITYRTKDHYFGRNLDYEKSFGEAVVVMPRNFPLSFQRAGTLRNHYAMIGMAHVAEGQPLYYDGVNEAGLAMAGLLFPHSTVYQEEQTGRNNVAPYELIPWLLGQCRDTLQARELLSRLNVAALPFNRELPLSPLHWLLADKSEALVIECTAEGLQVYENPVGVLTNEPPFPRQLCRLRDYLSLTAGEPENRFAPGVELTPCSRGMGAMGLPGDLSSQSRFIRGAFVRGNSVSGESEIESVSQFFRILESVAQPRGCVRLPFDQWEITRYSSCCNTDRGIYYYRTYENSGLTAVDLHREDLEGEELAVYSLDERMEIRRQN